MPKIGVIHSEKVTYIGLYSYNSDKWQFLWLYQTDLIPDTPGRSIDQLFFLAYGPKCPIFGPKIGSKWPKLPFCCCVSYISMKGVIFTYFGPILGLKIGHYGP